MSVVESLSPGEGKEMNRRVSMVFLSAVVVIAAAAGLPTAAMAGVVTGGGVYVPPALGFWNKYPPTNTFNIINFDKDAAGVDITNGTAITNQYQSWGVTFSLVSAPGTAQLVANSAGLRLGNLAWGDDSISFPNTLACLDLSVNGPLWVKIDFLPASFPYGLPREAGLASPIRPNTNSLR